MTTSAVGIMEHQNPRWGLVLLAREPEVLVVAQLCWHLALGAFEIHLYLDDPSDPVADAAAALPGVHVTRCDAAFWKAVAGERPALQTRRQTLVATHAYRSTTVDWLIHLDADEFLWMRQPLPDELTAHSALQGYIALPNFERAFTRPNPEHLFEGVFRVPLRGGKPLPDALADQAPFISKGVSGHASGKACVRTGFDMVLQPHAPRQNGSLPQSVRATSTVVLHFDGLTPLHWLIKLKRYAAHPSAQWEKFLGQHRRAQLLHAQAHGDDPAAMRAFHDRLKLCNDVGSLETAGLVERLAFDPAPAMQSFLGIVPDLDTASFDAVLRKAYPGLCNGL